MRIRVITSGLILGGLGLTGCMLPATSAPSAPSRIPAPSTSASSSPSAAPADSADDSGKADVKIDTCSVDGMTGWPSAKLTITNHSAGKANYIVNIEFLDGTTRVGTAIAAENDVAPGQSAKATAQGLEKAPGKITCRVLNPGRYPSL
ncbi:hypothetical protein [Streptomyces noursei]|uniref:hypothetical protein n=1 Tax=Streptomyces noursei TaxID=1971 RepID=UPI0023B7AB46|nr:hypothetical protein [Streptomyces noursei]